MNSSLAVERDSSESFDDWMDYPAPEELELPDEYGYSYSYMRMMSPYMVRSLALALLGPAIVVVLAFLF